MELLQEPNCFDPHGLVKCNSTVIELHRDSDFSLLKCMLKEKTLTTLTLQLYAQ